MSPNRDHFGWAILLSVIVWFMPLPATGLLWEFWDTNAEIDLTALTGNSAAISKADDAETTVLIQKFARDYDALDFGAGTGGTASGKYMIARERCDSGCSFEDTTPINVEGASRLICKVEFSSASAPTAEGYLAASDHNVTPGWIPIGSWDSENTGIPDDAGTDGLPALENAAAYTHGTVFTADVWGYEEINVSVTSDMGAGDTVSIWCDAI